MADQWLWAGLIALVPILLFGLIEGTTRLRARREAALGRRSKAYMKPIAFDMPQPQRRRSR